MILTAHAEILYFLIALVALFAISDLYMFYKLTTGGF